MSREATRALWLVIGAGLAIRVVLAFAFYGYAYDVDSTAIVRLFFAEEGFDLYGYVNAVEPVVRWPYPPGYIPLIFGADGLAGITPLPFHGLVQLPAIAADAGLAYLAQHYLGQRGATERTRLLAAGVIALGPLFILASGYHGQIDSLAILPAVAALVVWEQGGSRRALSAGLLIGLGAAIKIVPGFLLLALLPHARNARERLTLVGAAAALPVALLVPFAVSDPQGVKTLFEYSGAPGQGGLSLALQPGLAAFYVHDGAFDLNPLVEFLYDNGWLNAVLITVVGLALLRFRPPALLGAVLIWLALWTLGTSFFFHYLVWGLPFLAMAGFLRVAAAVQLCVLIPALLFYTEPWGEWSVWVYVPIMLVLWVGLCAFAVAIVRRGTAALPALASNTV